MEEPGQLIGAEPQVGAAVDELGLAAVVDSEDMAGVVTGRTLHYDCGNAQLGKIRCNCAAHITLLDPTG